MNIFTGVWNSFGISIDMFERRTIDNATQFSFLSVLVARLKD